MTVRLTVDRAAWQDHVRATAAAYGTALVPVVKGNGYGFGRPLLHGAVEALGTRVVCVGTIHEVGDVPAALQPVVLTPTLSAPEARTTGPEPVLTVGSAAHVAALDGWAGSVVVKLQSSMRRYGAAPGDLADLLRAVRRSNLSVAALGLHLPLHGTDAERAHEADDWLRALDSAGALPEAEVWLSHLAPASLAELAARHTRRRLRARVGTALWHGLPRGPFLHLGADVVQTTPVRAGETAGYRGVVVPFDGTLLALGAGSAHGVAPLDTTDPAHRSPFHYARQRLPLLEAPHMHTSLALVPAGWPCPAIGDMVDLQRPLISTHVDEVRFR